MMMKDLVVSAVCEVMGVSPAEFGSMGKTQRLCRARQMCTFLLCEMAHLSEVGAGRIVGGVPHYNRRRADALLEHDSGFREQHGMILAKLADANRRVAA